MDAVDFPQPACSGLGRRALRDAIAGYRRAPRGLAAGILLLVACKLGVAQGVTIGTDTRMDIDAIAGESTSCLPQLGSNDSGRTVVLVWQEYRNAVWAIYARRSINTGTSWLSEQILSTVTGPSAHNARDPRIASNNVNDVYVVWHAMDFGPNTDRIMFAKSTDDGANWSVPIALSSTSSYASEPEIAADGAGNVYVVWTQSDGTKDRVYLNSYCAATGLWSGAQAISASTAAIASGAVVACDNSHAYIAYLQSFPGLPPELYLRRSTAVACLSLAAEQKVNTVVPSVGLAGAQLAASQTAGGFVMVMWTRDFCALSSNWSTNGGQTFQAAEAAVATANCDPVTGNLFYGYDLATDTSGNAVSLYVRQPIDANAKVNVFSTRFSGSSWSAETQLTSAGSGATSAQKGLMLLRPSIAMSGSNVVAVWMQPFDPSTPGEPDYDIYAAWSTTGGTSWVLPPSSLTPSKATTDQKFARSAYPQVIQRGKKGFVVWDDRRAYTKPPASPGLFGNPATALGAPDVYLNIITFP